MVTNSTNQLLLAFYGDDFTGSTDAMEALAANGYRTILFTEPPSQEMLSRFEGVRCIGVAGTSRASEPEEMDQELTPVFERLEKLHIPIVHYKTCSTFDSSPEIGSIGQAIKTAKRYFTDSPSVPLLVAAPALGRYTVFGQHFARMKDTVYRLDRHPVMSKHPSTPMDEADLGEHLKKQIDAKIGLLNFNELNQPVDKAKQLYNDRLKENDVVVLDALTNNDMDLIGQLLWEVDHSNSQFVVGSSGVEYALTSHWANSGVSGSDWANNQSIDEKDNVLVVSGSVSMITQNQIETAISNGFKGVRIPVQLLMDDNAEQTKDYLQEALNLLDDGESVVLYTALGPNDEAVQETKKLLKINGVKESQTGKFIGEKLGQWTKYLLEQSELERVVIAGGDTSGFITKALGIYGLEMIQQVSPGAPLCKAYSELENMNGLELALKGGQLGSENYFAEVKKLSTNLEKEEMS